LVLQWSQRPADEEHAYGHEKADYLAAGVEGALILVAAVAIAYAAVGRLVNPALKDVGRGRCRRGRGGDHRLGAPRSDHRAARRGQHRRDGGFAYGASSVV